MGVELVEGRDLFCRDGVVRMRTTRGSEPVHVIYRRIDDDYLDPVHFRPDSVLGVPGLLNAARAGAVTIANGVGNGVADDKAVYPYVPTIVRYYLGRGAGPAQRAHLRPVRPRPARARAAPAGPDGGQAGGRLRRVRHRRRLGGQRPGAGRRGRCDSRPIRGRGWPSRSCRLSTSPTVVEGGLLAPRHLDLRPFAVNDGQKVWVLPGGLTRVALAEGSLVVNSSQGGGSKDTWVLDVGRRPATAPARARAGGRLRRADVLGCPTAVQGGAAGQAGPAVGALRADAPAGGAAAAGAGRIG